MKILRINEGGNYCGHAPAFPDFAINKPVKIGTGGHPRILTKLMKRVTEYYAAPKRKIPSLDQANDSIRQQRSERRESCLRLLIAMIKHMDLASLRIGQPTKDGFVTYDLKFLARESRLGKRRAERALKDLIISGLISTAAAQPRQAMLDGSYRGLAKPRLISPMLFTLFGLGEWLAFEQKKKVKKLKSTARELTEAGKPMSLTKLTRFKVFVRSISNKAGKSMKVAKKPGKSSVQSSTNDPEWNRALQILYGEIKAAHPTLSGDEIKSRANAQLKATWRAA